MFKFSKSLIYKETHYELFDKVLVEMNGECTYMNVGVKPCVIKHSE